MSTIASLLSNLLTDYKKSSAAVDSSTAVSTIPNNDNSNSGNYGDACVLDLSQAAQDILSSKSSNSVISLTDTQKQKLKDILDKYKDAPVNN